MQWLRRRIVTALKKSPKYLRTVHELLLSSFLRNECLQSKCKSFRHNWDGWQWAKSWKYKLCRNGGYFRSDLILSAFVHLSPLQTPFTGHSSRKSVLECYLHRWWGNVVSMGRDCPRNRAFFNGEGDIRDWTHLDKSHTPRSERGRRSSAIVQCTRTDKEFMSAVFEHTFQFLINRLIKKQCCKIF